MIIPDNSHIFTAIGSGALTAFIYRAAAGFVRTMPKPNPMERWYGWLYDFCQYMGANEDLRKKEQ